MENALALCSGYEEGDERVWELLSKIGVGRLQIPAPALEELHRVRSKLDRYGMEAEVLTAPYVEAEDVGKSEVTEAWCRAFDIAKELGVRVLQSSVRTEGTPGEEVYDWLRRAGDEAGERDVVLAMETHPNLFHNGTATRETLEKINHPNIRTNFDTGNITFYNEGMDAVEELKKVARYVASTHLKDHNGKFNEWNFGTLGTGLVHFRGILSVLRGVDYSGPWVMQLEGVKGEESSEEHVSERIRTSVAYLRGLGYD